MKSLRFLLLLGIAFLAVIFAGCRRAAATGKPADVDYYTCTMHPSVKSQDPKAKCPICSMDLVPVKKQGAAAGNGDDHAGHDHAAMPAGKSGEAGMAGTMPAGSGEKMTAEEKHRVSHRGRAFRTLADGLRIVQELEAVEALEAEE